MLSAGRYFQSFVAISETCDEREAVVLVSDTDPSRAAQYLRSRKIKLPLVAEPTGLQQTGFPEPLTPSSLMHPVQSLRLVV